MKERKVHKITFTLVTSQSMFTVAAVISLKQITRAESKIKKMFIPNYLLKKVDGGISNCSKNL